MQQKTTLISFLIIGISIAFITSCYKGVKEYAVNGEFHYINKLDRNIKIQLRVEGNHTFLKEHLIAPFSTLIIKTQGNSHSSTTIPKYYTPGIYADSIKVIFSDTLCYNEYHKQGLYFQNIHAYTYNKLGDRSYQFFLNIDSTILNLSSTCN